MPGKHDRARSPRSQACYLGKKLAEILVTQENLEKRYQELKHQQDKALRQIPFDAKRSQDLEHLAEHLNESTLNAMDRIGPGKDYGLLYLATPWQVTVDEKGFVIVSPYTLVNVYREVEDSWNPYDACMEYFKHRPQLGSISADQEQGTVRLGV